MIEIWIDIKGYEGIYQISNTGKVRSLDRYIGNQFIKGKLIKGSYTSQGYIRTTLSNGIIKKPLNVYIHRLVAEAFIPKIDTKHQVNHIDGNKENNHVDNLEWCNQRENNQHAYDNGLRDNMISVIISKNNETLEFKSIEEASKYIGCSNNNVHSAMLNKKRQKTACGWTITKKMII